MRHTRSIPVTRLLAPVLLGGLVGCSTSQTVIVRTDPPDATLAAVETLSGKAVSARQVAPGEFRVRVQFGDEDPKRYTLTATPEPGSRTHREAEVKLDSSRYAGLPTIEGSTRLLEIDLPPLRSLPPVRMQIGFENVRRTYRRLADGTLSIAPVRDEWRDITEGLRAELAEITDEDEAAGLRAVLAEMERVKLDDGSYTPEQETLGNRVTQLYDITLNVVLKGQEPVADLTERIAALSGRTLDGGPRRDGTLTTVPEFTPVRASITYRTTFIDSLLSIRVTGIAPIGAKVWLFGQDDGQRLEVERDGLSSRWSREVRVRPGRRFIYGVSEELVNGAPLNKAFRINIFSQETEEVPFAELDQLREREQ
ncbi:MAG: hypothetical protein AAGG07_12075 [Planctomycetota bacterium]